MFEILNGSEISTCTRSLSKMTGIDAMRVGVDLVSAARTNIFFLRTVAESHWLHQTPTLAEAVRRYDQLWMPLIADLMLPDSTPPMIVPPIDIEWVWFCHTLNPVSYKEYCERKFSKLICKPAIFDEDNEEYALMRCREIWNREYRSESFENEANSDSKEPLVVVNEEVFKEVAKQGLLHSKFAEPYRSDLVYLIAARQRYRAFLYMLQRFADESSSSPFVPTSDIMLMWLTHQSYPTIYMEDLKELGLENNVNKVATLWETPKEIDFEETKKLWDRLFDQPYEKAGGDVALTLERFIPVESPVIWDESDTGVNKKYRSMHPRFLLEACVFVRLKSRIKAMHKDLSHNFLRIRMRRCHKELKLDKAFSSFLLDSWQKACHLYCEFGSRGVIIEYRHRGGNCLKGSSLQDSVTFHWNDMLRAHSQTLEKEIGQHVTLVVSITPPVEAPYLLKCVPDRVTDDSGTMISDVFLKMNGYHPQQGRWLSRTVLDHAGRECFVIRIRIGGGVWRRGWEAPSAVKWEDRIIEIREGSWSYFADCIGTAPEKVVATATPKEPVEPCKAAWSFSTGDELMIQWESSLSMLGLSFYLRNQTSPESSVKLLRGRQMQYQVEKSKSKCKSEEIQNKVKEKETEEEEDEEGFLTVVRFTEENPIGKATALVNWKLLVIELLPEEDAALMLLLCISTLRSISEMKKEDVGGLLTRRRIKEARRGARDWGSVILHPSSFSPSIDLRYLQPWHWNAGVIMASDPANQVTRQPALNHSPVEGSDKLYKLGIIS